MILSIERKDLDPGIVVLELSGRIVLGNDAKTVEWKVDELLKQNCKRVIFDLSRVTILDSTGVGIVVMCFARVKKAGGSLRIAGASATVEQTLRMTNVDRLISMDPTVAAAAEILSSEN
jgi:anti-sigma B factor antagonist